MVIIDPGGDGADLIRRIKERGLKLQAVLLTHGHYDHAHHARMVADAFGVPVYASEKEEATMHDIQKNVSAMFGNPETYDADVYAKFGSFNCTVIIFIPFRDKRNFHNYENSF